MIRYFTILFVSIALAYPVSGYSELPSPEHMYFSIILFAFLLSQALIWCSELESKIEKLEKK